MEIHCKYFYLIEYSKKKESDRFYRVSIDELQKHVELDSDKENEFTIEEVRVWIFLF
jgi:hypothetical protein